MPSLAVDAGSVGESKPRTLPEAVEPTSSVPFQDEVAWSIRVRDYITVACHRYQLLSTFMMALVAVLMAYLIHGDAFGWLQQNSRRRMAPHNSVVLPVLSGTLAASVAIFALVTQRYFFSTRSVYCIDHCEFNPPDEWKVSRADIVKLLSTDHNISPDSLDFIEKLLAHSGTSDHTAFPPNLVRALDREGVRTHIVPMKVKSLKTGERWSATLEDSREEAGAAMGGALKGLMDKTGITAKDIDVLIVNCSLLSPTPSLCALLVNKFGMRSDVLTYNLSGMGCSANGVSIDLAQRVLQNPKNMKCVVISTESIAQAIYPGNERGFLVQNTLFRCGATAILLTNKPDTRAKYKLLNVVRAQLSKGDDDYGCVWEAEDKEGYKGVFLAKNIVDVAGKTMTVNFKRLVPRILPIPELLKVAFNKKYVPSFKKGINHFCIHAGGRAVLEGVQKNLKLSDRDILPSKLSLYHMGNTSSSSIWYELGFTERSGDLKAGHRILQVAFGSGFKCNSMVWLCLRN